MIQMALRLGAQQTFLKVGYIIMHHHNTYQRWRINHMVTTRIYKELNNISIVLLSSFV